MKPSFNTATYIVDEEYKIRNFNEYAKKCFPDIEQGAFCYKAINGFTSPCPNCPIFTKQDNGSIFYRDAKTKKDYYSTFSNMPLKDGSNGYVINCYESSLSYLQEHKQIALMKHKVDIYRLANYQLAYLYFECNLSQNVLVSDIYEVVDNVETVIDLSNYGFTNQPIHFNDYVEWRLNRGVVSNRDEFRSISDINNLIRDFHDGKKSVSLKFRAKSTNGYLVWHEVTYYLYKSEYSDDVYALCVLRDVTHKLQEETNSRRNEQIMQMLAREYSSVLYYDLGSNLLSICSLSPHIDSELKYAAQHYSIDNLWRLYLDSHVQNSDREKIEPLAKPEVLRDILKNKKTYAHIYRVGSETEYTYYELKIVKVGEENDPVNAVVIGIADRNEVIVRQQEQRRQLDDALLLAQRDSLTGIRNRTAYDLEMAQIDKDLANGNLKEFAILMCDVNNLKIANDKYGHDKGNLLLIDSAKLICDIFKHSMVCRLGGDEFVAIIKGTDYKNREKLLNTIRETVLKNEKKRLPTYKKVSIATGLAVYDPAIDKNGQNVAVRADNLMYENKQSIKNIK